MPWTAEIKNVQVKGVRIIVDVEYLNSDTGEKVEEKTSQNELTLEQIEIRAEEVILGLEKRGDVSTKIAPGPIVLPRDKIPK